MAITKTFLLNIASEFSSVTEERVTTLAAHAAHFVGRDVFKGKTDYATALLVAHMLKLDTGKGVAGGVASESLGDISRSYVVDTSSEGLNQTSYGRQFVALRRTCATGPMVV